MCIRALRMQSEDGNTKATVCKTIACLLPNDLEVKRACQLTQFLLEPTVDSYYAVETLYNEPDQKMEVENMPVPNSLRCELLLVFKTQWPFDPEFWDWRTLKRHCLALMGEEASIVSSIDLLNDTDEVEEQEVRIDNGFLESAERMVSGTYELADITDRKKKNREMKKLREKGFISARFRNWQAYMQYCVLCDKEFLGHRIIRHAQTHFSSGVYSCPICAESFTSKDTLTPHVTSHVKQSCKDRLTAMKTNKKLANPKTAAPVIAALIAKTENQVSENDRSLGHNSESVQYVQARLRQESSEENMCPVGTCKKTFKFYRNLIAHVKAHGDNEEAKSYLEMRSKKVVCQYCRRHFVNVNHLNNHLQVHCGVKPYICIQLNCKASFLANTELLVHRKTHTSFKARCMFPNCGKIFNEAFKLYDHEAQHYKTFTCKFVDCGKVFHTQQQLDLHHMGHTTKNEQEVPPSEQKSLNLQSSPSVTAQTIPDQAPLNEQENPQVKCEPESVSVGRPETLESLLKSSQMPIETVDRYKVKAVEKDEGPISQKGQIVSNSVIQPTHLQPTDPHVIKDASSRQSLNYLTPSQQKQHQHVSPFEATINKMLHDKTLLHGQLQILSSSIKSGSNSYSAEAVCSVSRPVPPIPQTENITKPVMLQPLPPTGTPLIANQSEKTAKPSTCTVLRERYHCAYETCTRNYSCYKSVAKHMKTSHPEFYAQRKIPRSEIMVTYVSGPPLVSKPKMVVSQENQQKVTVQGAVRQNVIQSPSYTSVVTNYKTIGSHSPTSVNHSASCLMESVLNRIVVSQLKSNPDQANASETKDQPNWSSASQNEQILKCGPSQIHQTRQVESPNAPLPPKGPPYIPAVSNPNNTVVDSFLASNMQSSCQTFYRPAATNADQLQSSHTKNQAESQPMWLTIQNKQIVNSATSQIHSTGHVETTDAPSPSKGLPYIPLESDPNHTIVDSLQTSSMPSGSRRHYRPASTKAGLPPKSSSKIQEETPPTCSMPTQNEQIQLGGPSQICPNRQVESISALFPPKGPLQLLGPEPNHSAEDTFLASHTHRSSQPIYRAAAANVDQPKSQPIKKGQPTWSTAPIKQEKSQPTWSPAHQNEQILNGVPSQIHSTKLMKSNNTSSAPKCPLGIPKKSRNNVTASLPALSVQSSFQPILLSTIKTEENSQVISLPALQNVARQPENTKPEQHNLALSNFQSSQPQQRRSTSKENPDNSKPVRKRRTKWPAIIRDGKFICSRCYREFNSSKSLGGHLSKRTSCKPYEETVLNTDLPTSFLDLLNSEQTVNNLQSDLSYNPCVSYYSKPHTSEKHGPVEQKSNSSQNYQENLPAHINGETNHDILKQIMTASNMDDLFVQPQVSQFQNSDAPYRLSTPSSSVIQHMEGVQREVGSYNTHLPQSRLNTLPANRCPTPLLSQVLKENQPNTVLEKPTINPIDFCIKICHTESNTADINPVTQTLLSESQPSPATSDSKQTERKNNEQDIKKKLREQILAGDFQRRSHLCHFANADTNVESQSPLSISTESSPRNKDTQRTWDAKGFSAVGENYPIIPGTLEEIKELLKTQSFTCLRQITTPKQTLQSPARKGPCDNRDTELKQLSSSQQQWFTEIQTAFERLNLVREAPEQILEHVNPNTSIGSSHVRKKVMPQSPQTLTSHKIYTCEAEHCEYSTGSSEAFWRHLYKVHNYTFDLVNAVKKRYGQYAPFQCQKCNKTFTRNPNLRTHYISAHQLSSEEIKELDLKRRKARASTSRIIQLQSVDVIQSLPASVTQPLVQNVNQALLHLKTANPGCASVIQALPIANLHNQACTGGPHRNVASGLPKGLLTPGKQGNNRSTTVKSSCDLNKKTDKKLKSNDALSQYRPYRCVHQGCEAAFTIQHNLILHYRAVHQSALSALEVNKEQDQNEATDEVIDQEEEEDVDVPHISEFRCQVKDCSRVFQQVPLLMLHYLRLHEFSIDKVGDLLTGISLGRFICGHQGCSLSFTAFWKFVAHIKELHKDFKLSKPERLYKCKIEGCDRAYATKSNMLRHFMKKHQDLYQPKRKHPPKTEDGVKQNSKTLQYQLNKTSDGKENIESNKKISQKDCNSKRSRKTNNYWTKYEKPVLKTNVEASAMCTKSYPLQYPCKIKGCESVMNSERSILKHYTVHGLSEKFLEQHRSHYIFCKKFPRQKSSSLRSDDSKSDHSSDSEPELTVEDTEQAQYEDSKPFLRKRSCSVIPAALIDGLSNNDSSDGSVVMKRKRGRPKKIIEKIVKRKKLSRPPKTADDGLDSTYPAQLEVSEQPAPLATFKPMGFEMSFLKFLEQSNKTQPSFTCDIPLVGPWVRLSQLNTKETCVRFSNRQNLKSLNKVKIVVDKAFLGVTDLMLKQLQDMQPTVVLEKK